MAIRDDATGRLSKDAPTAHHSGRVSRWLRRSFGILSCANFFVVCILLLLIRVVSEDWWFSTALMYLPRLPYLLPAVVLLVITLLLRSRWAGLNLLSVLLVIGPLMELHIPNRDSIGEAEPLTLVTCNVQSGRPEMSKVLEEIDALDPDIVVLQEVPRTLPLLEEHFADWHNLHAHEYWISSRYPLREVNRLQSEAFRHWNCLLLEVDAPDGPFLVADVHLATPRHGLTQLKWDSFWTSEGVFDQQTHQQKRRIEIRDLVEFIESQAGNQSLILAGDFNTPSQSALMRRSLPTYQNAFGSAVSK